jgi:ABC-2 type transport system ATP-binding protein
MRRRLDLAGALVAEPPVLFLDEPTTGLDIRSRAGLWSVIRELVGRGATLMLTTQYLEEADVLADEILVIDHGRAIAHGTPDQLKTDVGGERIEVVVAEAATLEVAQRVLARFAVGEVQVNDSVGVTAPISGGAPVLTEALRQLDDEGVVLRDVGLRRPTLDDVFLTLTGHHAEEEEKAAGDVEDKAGGDGAAKRKKEAR